MTPMYLQAIRTALNVHQYDQAVLWYSTPEPPDVGGLKIELVQKFPHIDPSYYDPSHLNLDRDAHLDSGRWSRVVSKDVILWDLASTTGGIFLDSDTTSRSDISCLLGDHDFVSPVDVVWNNQGNGWRNNAILVCKPNSEVAKKCFAQTKNYLSMADLPLWCIASKLLTDILNSDSELLAKTYTPRHRELGAFCGGSEAAAYVSGNTNILPPFSRVIHWFSSSKEMSAFPNWCPI